MMLPKSTPLCYHLDVATEKAITKRIINWIKAQPGGHAIKMTPHGDVNRGEPDIFACYHGYMVLIEVKKPDGILEPLQLAKLSKWSRAEARAMIVTDLEPVKLLFQDIDALVSQ